MGDIHGDFVEKKRVVAVHADFYCDPMNPDAKFIINVKKNEVVGVITIYILREIRFHMNRIDRPLVV